MGTRTKPPEPGRRLITRDQHLAALQRYEDKMVAPRIDALTGRIISLEADRRVTFQNFRAVAAVLGFALALLFSVAFTLAAVLV